MLRVAGVGPGNPKYLTKHVEEKIRQAKNVLAFGRISESLQRIREDIIRIDRVDQLLEFLKKEEEILLLASGDPNFFGIVNYLKKNQIEIEEVLPGISSFQYMTSKLQKPWQEAKFLSLHGREDDLSLVKDCRLAIILIDKDNMPGKISKDLYQIGVRGRIYAGFNLSYEDESLISKNIGEEIEDISSLGVVIIENEMD